MRAVNRLVVALLSLAIAGAGLLAAAEVLVAQTSWPHKPPLVVPYNSWLDYLRPHTWNETVVRLGSIAAIVVGLLLLVAAVVGRERRVQMISAHPDVDLSTSRRSLARTLRKEAGAVDGVGSATARVRKHTATISATARLGDPAEVEQRVRSTVTSRLGDIALAETPKLTVRVRPGRPE
jgi:uncharacterized protein DUF6286